MDTVKMVNKEDKVYTKREILENLPQKITSDSNKENGYNGTEKLAPIPRELSIYVSQRFLSKNPELHEA